jgi:hypothetical protein
MKNKEELFKEFLLKNTEYKDFVDRVTLTENKLYVIVNNRFEKGIENFLEEIKSYSTMFGVDKVYECFEVTDKLTLHRNITYSFSGTTSF